MIWAKLRAKIRAAKSQYSILSGSVQGHWEVVLGVVEADVLDHFSEQGHIARQEP